MEYPNSAYNFTDGDYTGNKFVHGIALGLLFTSIYGVKKFCAGGNCNLNKDLSDKTVVITGANSGIGKQAARRLLELNATVIFGARDIQKNDEVVKQFSLIKKGKILSFHLDLGDKMSIQNFTENVKRQLGNQPLHYLLNNAGIIGIQQRKKTKDGLQMQMGVNHFGHFYLTYLLWDKLKQSGNPRIVNVSSIGHTSFRQNHDLDFDNLQFQNGGYDYVSSYSRSKKANIIFAKQLQRRMQQSGIQGICVSLHPGLVRTDIQRNFLNWWNRIINTILYPIIFLVIKTAKQGSQTSIYCLLEDDKKLVKGGYYSDCKLKKTGSLQVQDIDIAKRLWEVSEKVWGIKFNV